MIEKFYELFKGLLLKFRLLLKYNCRSEGWKLRVGRGSRISLGKKAKCVFNGKYFFERNCQLSVRETATFMAGKNFFMNIGGIIVVKDTIEIGDNVQLGPYVQIYDHDHDFKVTGGLKSGMFKTAPVKIGNNVWIGAGSIILMGTVIGDNCVIGAGSIVKGEIPSNTIMVQKRENNYMEYEFKG